MTKISPRKILKSHLGNLVTKKKKKKKKKKKEYNKLPHSLLQSPSNDITPNSSRIKRDHT